METEYNHDRRLSNQNTKSAFQSNLSPHHLKHLSESSKIRESIIEGAGLLSFSQQVAREFFGRTDIGCGVAFPYLDFNGNIQSYRMRLDDPTVGIKYVQKAGVAINCYFLKTAIDLIKDPNKPIYVTEGEKKLLSIESNITKGKHPVVSYPGCWNWTTGGTKKLAGMWEQIPWKDRDVYWVPDTDFFYNETVTAAGTHLLRDLLRRGARVHLIDLRIENGSSSSKIGADDFIVKYGEQDFEKLCKTPGWTHVHRPDLSSLDGSYDALQPVLENAVLLQAIEIDPFLKKIKNCGGYSIPQLRDEFHRIRDLWKALLSKPPENEKFICLNCEIPRTTILANLGSALERTSSCYRYGSDLVIIHRNDKHLITSDTLPAVISSIGVETGTVSDKGPNHIVLPLDLSRAFMNHLDLIPRFNKISLYTTNPSYSINWNLTAPGYDPDEQVYYNGEEITPSNSTSLITTIINDFCFRDSASRHNFVALLITILLRNHHRGQRPFGAFTANRPNVGKTLACQILAIIASGDRPASCTFTPNEEEMEKKIGAIASSNDIILIDNVRAYGNRPINSAPIERLITSDPMVFRRLGFSENIKRDNTTLTLITMNNATFGEDLTSRSLPIQFFLDEDSDPNARKFERDEQALLEFVSENRVKILSELCGMVEKWKSLGRPPLNKDFRFRAWARDVGGILSVNGFTEFLGNLGTAYSEYDSIAKEIGRAFEDHIGRIVKASDLIQSCREKDIFPEACEKSNPAKSLTNILKKYSGRTIPIPDGKYFILKEMEPDAHAKVCQFLANPINNNEESQESAGNAELPAGELTVARASDFEFTRELTQCAHNGNSALAGMAGEQHSPFTCKKNKNLNTLFSKEEKGTANSPASPATEPKAPDSFGNKRGEGSIRSPADQDASPASVKVNPLAPQSENELEW